ncbi:hypothetical protein ACN4EK_09340 [Pantanalinema rosaneae CENA516]|uniref:hypothetical protein n=1 Tax=Pantanalinema rosaneae TaxID=1620701 RepID=UPI003D6E11F3
MSPQLTNQSQPPKNLPLTLTVSVLEAYEGRTPPPGSRGHYPVGNAVVRLRMENLSQQPVALTIASVKITSLSGQPVLMEKAVGQVELGGLQIQESGLRLTNEQGFSHHQTIQAIVTYSYQGKTFTVTSPGFDVSVFH